MPFSNCSYPGLVSSIDKSDGRDICSAAVVEPEWEGPNKIRKSEIRQRSKKLLPPADSDTEDFDNALAEV